MASFFFFLEVLIFVMFVGVTKFSTYTAALSTCNLWTSDILLWPFFTICSPLTVTLIHRVAFLIDKLSCMWWLSKCTEKWKMQKHVQKRGPIPLVHQMVVSHTALDTKGSPFLVKIKIPTTCPEFKVNIVIHDWKYITPQKFILGDCSSFSWTFPPTKIAHYTVRRNVNCDTWTQSRTCDSEVSWSGMCFAMKVWKMALGVLCNLVSSVQESSAEYELMVGESESRSQSSSLAPPFHCVVFSLH